MKKLIEIIVLSLLLNNSVLATIISTEEQKELITKGTIKKGMTKELLELTISPSAFSAGTVSIFDLKKSGVKVWCSFSGVGYCFDGKANKKNSKLIQIWDDPYEMADYWLKKATHKKNIKQINIFKVDIKKYGLIKRYSNKSNINNTNTSSNLSNTNSSSSTDDKIAQSKQICKDLGFKVNTEKFADCALKMMSMQFEATNKIASSGGTTQEIIVKHKNDYDIWDALIDTSTLLRNNSTSNSSSSSGTNCKVYQREWGADMVCQ